MSFLTRIFSAHYYSLGKRIETKHFIVLLYYSCPSILESMKAILYGFQMIFLYYVSFPTV